MKMTNVIGVIINDCHDDLARGRAASEYELAVGTAILPTNVTDKVK